MLAMNSVMEKLGITTAEFEGSIQVLMMNPQYQQPLYMLQAMIPQQLKQMMQSKNNMKLEEITTVLNASIEFIKNKFPECKEDAGELPSQDNIILFLQARLNDYIFEKYHFEEEDLGASILS